MKRRLLFALFALLTISSAAWAQTSWEVPQGKGQIKYTVVKKPSGTDLGTVSVEKGSTLPTGSLTIPETVDNGGDSYTVTSIPKGAFSNCTELTRVSVPVGVTNIGKNAFLECNALKGVTINGSLDKISESAFEGCTNLKSFKIPVNVTEINARAFHDCDSLVNISIPENVTSIGASAFADCDSLKSITIPKNVTKIGDKAFNVCRNMETFRVDKDNANYYATDGVLYDKAGETLIHYPIGNTRTSFVIPEGVTAISDVAFKECLALTSISISSTVATIGEKAFEGCIGLKSIISKNPTPPTTGTDVFLDVLEKNVDGVYVPSAGITDYKTADRWKKFEKIIQALTYDINNGEYNLSYEITSGSNGNRTVKLLGLASGETDRTAGLVIPATVVISDSTYSVTSIDDDAFADCAEFTSITIGSNVETIGMRAFAGCTGLTTINIPEAVTSIALRVFRDCTNLESISVDENNTAYTAIDNILYTKNKAVLVQYPIGNSATSFIIPEGVESIEVRAFANCTNLTSITIPATVTSIGVKAFTDCTGLTSITSKSITPPAVDIEAFENVNAVTTVYVPSASIEQYKIADEWSKFASNYQAIIYTAISGSYNLKYELTNDTEGNRTVTLLGLADGETASNENLVIPDEIEIDGKIYKVTAIADSAFEGETGFGGTLTIGANVSTIGAKAFYNGPSFYEIISKNTTPPNATDDSFEGIPNYHLVYVPYASLDDYKNATNGWKHFQDSYFKSIPYTVSNGTYELSYEITNDTDGSRTVMLLGLADRKTIGTEDLIIPSEVEIDSKIYKVTAIAERAFQDNTDLTGGLKIGSNIETIETHAFYNSSFTGGLTIPSSVKVIEVCALSIMTGITEIIVDDTNTAFAAKDGVLYSSDMKTLICFPAGKSATNFVIPDGIKTIDHSAFEGCLGLTGTLTIPATVETINDKAFYNCSGITSIFSSRATSAIADKESFAGMTNLEAVYVPRTSIEKYQKAMGWNNIEEEKFKSLTYIVSAKATTGGSASATPSGSDVSLNSKVTFAATADYGYEFEKWTDDTNATVSTDVIYVVKKLDSDMNLTAHFKQIDPAILLEREKTAKNDAIDKLFEDYNEDNYRSEQWEELKNLFDEAKEAVSEAADLEELKEISVDALKANANAVKTTEEMIAYEQNVFENAKADLQASIVAAENKQAEEGYETKYTAETRKSVFDALYNAKKTLDEYGNSTDVTAATAEMRSSIHSLDTAIERLKENPTVGIDEVEGSEPFTRDGNTLLFAKPTQIAVYSMNGRMMYTGKTEEYILPEASGIYILRTANGSWKLARQ